MTEQTLEAPTQTSRSVQVLDHWRIDFGGGNEDLIGRYLAVDGSRFRFRVIREPDMDRQSKTVFVVVFADIRWGEFRTLKASCRGIRLLNQMMESRDIPNQKGGVNHSRRTFQGASSPHAPPPPRRGDRSGPQPPKGAA